MVKRNLIPIALIIAGIFLLLPMISKSGKFGEGLDSILPKKQEIVCEVTITSKIIGFGDITRKNCIAKQSYLCNIAQTQSIGDILYREGTIKILMDNGDDKTEKFKVFIGETSTGVIEICSEDKSGKLQLFDLNGNLKDEEVFQVA